MMNLPIICDAFRLKRNLQLLDPYIHTIMQALMWTRFANYFYRNIPVQWRLQAYFLSNWFYVCTMNMLHWGSFILMGFIFSIKLLILTRCHDWIIALEHTTLKCQKFNGIFFRNVTPLFKSLRTGLTCPHFSLSYHWVFEWCNITDMLHHSLSVYIVFTCVQLLSVYCVVEMCTQHTAWSSEWSSDL